MLHDLGGGEMRSLRRDSFDKITNDALYADLASKKGQQLFADLWTCVEQCADPPTSDVNENGFSIKRKRSGEGKDSVNVWKIKRKDKRVKLGRVALPRPGTRVLSACLHEYENVVDLAQKLDFDSVADPHTIHKLVLADRLVATLYIEEIMAQVDAMKLEFELFFDELCFTERYHHHQGDKTTPLLDNALIAVLSCKKIKKGLALLVRRSNLEDDLKKIADGPSKEVKVKETDGDRVASAIADATNVLDKAITDVSQAISLGTIDVENAVERVARSIDSIDIPDGSEIKSGLEDIDLTLAKNSECIGESLEALGDILKERPAKKRRRTEPQEASSSSAPSSSSSS